MLITAKFNGTCAQCGSATRKGESIEYVDKKAYHPDCANRQEPDTGETPDQIADRLGFFKCP